MTKQNKRMPRIRRFASSTIGEVLLLIGISILLGIILGVQI